MVGGGRGIGHALVHGYQPAMIVMAALCAGAAVITALFVSDSRTPPGARGVAEMPRLCAAPSRACPRQLRLFPRGEVPALVDLMDVGQVGIGTPAHVCGGTPTTARSAVHPRLADTIIGVVTVRLALRVIHPPIHSSGEGQPRGPRIRPPRDGGDTTDRSAKILN